MEFYSFDDEDDSEYNGSVLWRHPISLQCWIHFSLGTKSCQEATISNMLLGWTIKMASFHREDTKASFKEFSLTSLAYLLPKANTGNVLDS